MNSDTGFLKKILLADVEIIYKTMHELVTTSMNENTFVYKNKPKNRNMKQYKAFQKVSH